MIFKKFFILIILLFFSTSDAMAIKILEDIGKTLDKAVKKGAEEILKDVEKKEKEKEKTEDKETQKPAESKPVPKKEAEPKKPVPKKAEPKKAEQKKGDHITKGDITLLNTDEVEKLLIDKIFVMKSFREGLENIDWLVYLKYFGANELWGGSREEFILFNLEFTDRNKYPNEFDYLELSFSNLKGIKKDISVERCVSFKELETLKGCLLGYHFKVINSAKREITVDKNGKFVNKGYTPPDPEYFPMVFGIDSKTNKIYSFDVEEKSTSGGRYLLVEKKAAEWIEFKNEKEGPKHFIDLMANRIGIMSDEERKKKEEKKEKLTKKFSEEELKDYRGGLGGKDDFKFGMKMEEVKNIINAKCAKDDNTPSPDQVAIAQDAYYSVQAIDFKNMNLIFPYISKEILGKAFKNIDFKLRGISCFSILGGKPKYNYFGFDKNFLLSVIYVDSVLEISSEQKFDDVIKKRRNTMLNKLIEKYNLLDPQAGKDATALANDQMTLIESGSSKETLFMYQQNGQVSLFIRNIPDDLQAMFGGPETSILSTQEYSILYTAQNFGIDTLYPIYQSIFKSSVESETGGGL